MITRKNCSYIATTQPTTQNKAKQLGWCGIIIGKKPTTPPPRPQRVPLHFGMQPCFISTRRNMEDDLYIFEIGRKPNFFKWKTT